MSVIIRRYRDEDLPLVAQLFYNTVHSVNAADYTEQQLYAWAPDERYLLEKRAALLRQNTFVAEDDGEVVGFASADGECLDMLFVRHDRLREGIASALCDMCEKGSRSVTTFASVTARRFFEKRGYTVVKEQTVTRRGTLLKNYEMRKS